jgi:deoxyribodipyrimidine photo-lyase
MEKINLVWLRRDLRLEDNSALYHALKCGRPVLPIFIFDTHILSKLEDKCDRRLDFIHQALGHIQSQMVKFGSTLHVFNGEPLEVFKTLLKSYKVEAVYTNHDYEPYAIKRDKEVDDLLNQLGVCFKSFKDQCVFEKSEIVKDDGKPYTVFTPYSRKWKLKLSKFYYTTYPTELYQENFIKLKPIEIISLEELGFKKTDINFNVNPNVSKDLLKKYKEQRDYPSVNGTSRLSMHLRFGTISIRSLVQQALSTSETWLNELIWRDFYMMILYHFPHVVNGAFKKQYDLIAWRNNEDYFKKWCEGKTGFPIVDAGMRELNSTGFMHNRVRMIVSSFLVKDLLTDWRWGEAYFAAKLNDFDLSANNGGWQWAAGTGCDAAPYFRVFNPTEQQKKFDPNFSYIKKWVPEFGTPEYVLPIVDHAKARLAAIQLYKNRLTDKNQFELFE